jgi:hypothetical protein
MLLLSIPIDSTTIPTISWSALYEIQKVHFMI